MSYITAIGIANPPHRFSQSKIADFMVKAMQLNQNESRLLHTIFKASGIDYRYSVLILVFTRLVSEGWLKVDELVGIGTEKVDVINKLTSPREG